MKEAKPYLRISREHLHMQKFEEEKMLKHYCREQNLIIIGILRFTKKPNKKKCL